MTQKLCLTLTEESEGTQSWDDEAVDQLVERLFLSKEAQKETNLQFVRDYVRTSPQRHKLMQLYRQIQAGKVVTEDERSLYQNQLKLFGLVKSENNALAVRNEIYRRVFNQAWIKANTPVDWGRRIIIISIFIIIGLVGLLIYSQLQVQTVAEEQAQILIENFRQTNSADVRMTSLAGLYDLHDFDAQANDLFYDELSREERLALFEAADPAAVGSQMVTVVKALYTDLENNERDNALLQKMVASLDGIDEGRAITLVDEIETWQRGREYFNQQDYQQAVTLYDLAIEDADRNPGLYLDRGLAYVAMEEAGLALADFETVVTLDETRQTRIEQIVSSNSLLYNTAIATTKDYPALIALVPSPTHTPTMTPTSTSTPTPTATATATPSPTLTPTPPPATNTPTTVPPTETAAAVVVESTVAPPTETPTTTPTPTPQPAEVVFVQSRGQFHTLSLVSSRGELLQAEVHTRAAAPAYSPDGAQVAFYGEEGISELGGIYAQGSGIWILDLTTGGLELFQAIDHITNMAWSPAGDKLAIEVGPPSEVHQVFIYDVRDGKELNRFAAEQPAWSPDGQELIVKSCSPECGLWRVGLDGQGGRLLTPDSTDSYPTWSPTGRYLAFTSRARTGIGRFIGWI